MTRNLIDYLVLSFLKIYFLYNQITFESIVLLLLLLKKINNFVQIICKSILIRNLHIFGWFRINLCWRKHLSVLHTQNRIHLSHSDNTKKIVMQKKRRKKNNVLSTIWLFAWKNQSSISWVFSGSACSFSSSRSLFIW